VIASRVPLADAELGSRAIQIVMTPSCRDMSPLDLEAEEQLAATFQPMLQMFRFLHYTKVAASQVREFLKFPPGLRDSARALAAPMLGDEELQKQLVEALENQVHSMQFDRFAEPEWVVMRALYGLCHKVSSEVYVQDVMKESNRILGESGETGNYSAKAVGQILNKVLGFSTRRRGAGYRIMLTPGIRKKIHGQAKAMRLNISDIMGPHDTVVSERCPLCAEFGLMIDHEGLRVRTISELNETACRNCGRILAPGVMRCPHCETSTQAA
jgi:hypothetical protein